MSVGTIHFRHLAVSVCIELGTGQVTRNTQLKDALTPRHGKGLHIGGHGLRAALFFFFPQESKSDAQVLQRIQ